MQLIEPMSSEATSGSKRAAAASRCSIVIVIAPPVVMLLTASVSWARAETNGRQISGSGEGRLYRGENLGKRLIRLDRPSPEFTTTPRSG